MSKTIWITGANRGIGLEMTKQWLANGNQVVVLCRKQSDALTELQQEYDQTLTFVQADVSSESGLNALNHLDELPKIDVLVNCAGILSNENLDNMDFEAIQRQFIVNSIGPIRMVMKTLNHFNDAGKVVMITSRMGSIADNDSGGMYGYRMSKAALNAGSMSLVRDLKKKGIAVGIFHPGFVKTDMTNNTGNITPDESAAGLIKLTNELTLENAGKFMHMNGEALPW